MSKELKFQGRNLTKSTNEADFDSLDDSSNNSSQYSNSSCGTSFNLQIKTSDNLKTESRSSPYSELNTPKANDIKKKCTDVVITPNWRIMAFKSRYKIEGTEASLHFFAQKTLTVIFRCIHRPIDLLSMFSATLYPDRLVKRCCCEYSGPAN